MLHTRNNIMLYEAKKAKHKPHILLQILIFIVVILATQAATGLIIGVPLGLSMTSELLNKINPADLTLSFGSVMSFVSDYMKNLPQWFNVLSLFATALVTFLIFVYCRAIEGRSYASMGISKKGMAGHYGFGYLIGIAMMTATVSLAVLLGGAKFTGLNQGVPLSYLALFFFGYLVQGMSEEVCFRGYFMVSCANKVPVAWAVMISSVAFALMHLANPGITPLAVFNLVLFGAFAAVYILRTDDLWGACAIHSAWNFFQGNVFGISVSGTGAGASIFGTAFVSGRGLISGDLFGIEGGLCTTIVLLAGIALVLFLPQKARPELPPEEPPIIGNRNRGPLPVYIEK
ncbi:MAG: CPBP family intramembrane metalloprotease [Oscillospiraceae bacterium]